MRRKGCLQIGGLVGLGFLAFWAVLFVPSSTPAQAATRSLAAEAATPSTAATAAPPGAGGYWLVAADGGIFSFGDATFYGSTGALHLNQPIVGMAATPDGHGYWLVASDGGIFSFGDATFYGSTGALHLNQPIVGMAATPDGEGYWLVAADGGIFSFGDATFYGSTGALHLNQPIVGMAATPDGHGYWLVAADGGIFSFGDATFYGSTGALHLNQPIVGMAATPDGHGYWLVAADGGIFSFGDAGYFGSIPSEGGHVGNIVALAASEDGLGYWVAGGNGSVNSFGDAQGQGSTAGVTLHQPIVGFAGAGGVVPGQESPVPLTITTTTLPDAQQGVPYSASLAATGGTPPYSWKVVGGSLPAGLALSASGTLSGTAEGPGSTTFTVQASDTTAPTALEATATLSLTVSLVPLEITTSTVPNAIVGAPYSLTLSATGGSAPYIWTLTGGSLPAGLTLSSHGVLAGTPTGQSGSGFTVQVIDSTVPTSLAAAATYTIATFPASLSGPTSTSSNWSGYVEVDGPFTSVTGTFSVPSLVPGSSTNDLFAEWVGIDGGNGDNALIQAGLNESAVPGDPGAVLIQPWWEILPAPETFITGMQISVGDAVTVTIDQISGTQWAINMVDDTNGGSFTIDRTYTGPALTAEWIVEALTFGGKVATLAPYTPVVSFTHLGFSAATTSLAEIVMVQDSSQVSTPSALTAEGFNVAYGNVAPQPP